MLVTGNKAVRSAGFRQGYQVVVAIGRDRLSHDGGHRRQPHLSRAQASLVSLYDGCVESHRGTHDAETLIGGDDMFTVAIHGY